MVINAATQNYIAAHLQDDVRQLALKGCKDASVDLPFALQQISARQQIRHKLPALAAHANVVFPERLPLEQCSSELTARYKATLIKGTHLADLTGGFGIDTLYIAENFQNVEYVERNEELCHIAAHNFALLDKQQIHVHNADGMTFIAQRPEIDTLYLDPARRNSQGRKTVLISDCEPDITLYKEHLTALGRHTWVKLSPMLDIHSALNELPVCEVYVIAAENECKELLLHLHQEDEPYDIPIYSIQLTQHTPPIVFHHTLSEEHTAQPCIATHIKRYLYDPNTTLLKSGAFKSIACRYGLEKLHVNTHLYTSDELKVDFCGRIFEVQASYGASKKDLSVLKEYYPKANVATRNFPLTADQLRKKAGLSDGGDNYLYGVTIANNQRVVLACRKVK